MPCRGPDLHMAVAAHEHPFAVPRLQHHVKFHVVARAKRTRREVAGNFRPVVVRCRHILARRIEVLKIEIRLSR